MSGFDIFLKERPTEEQVDRAVTSLFKFDKNAPRICVEKRANYLRWSPECDIVVCHDELSSGDYRMHYEFIYHSENILNKNFDDVDLAVGTCRVLGIEGITSDRSISSYSWYLIETSGDLRTVSVDRLTFDELNGFRVVK
jgi:hypothetical protein